MSIQTEINRISAEVANQTDLIAQIKTVLAEKAAAAPVLQSKTVTPSTSEQTVAPDAGFDGLSQVTVNAMPTATQATPAIIVSDAGLITASATQAAGYVEAGTQSVTEQLTTQEAQTITPGTADIRIESGRYLTGEQTIKGDANLLADNIKSGVSIFGVAGSYEGSGSSGGAAVETCTVTIDVSAYDGNYIYWAYASTLDASGATQFARHEPDDTTATVTITDVICNTMIYASQSKKIYGVEYQYAVDNGMDVLSGLGGKATVLFTAPTTDGAHGTIRLKVAEEEGTPQV